MRNGTDAVLALENPPPEAPSYTTNDLLKMFADEAAIYQDFNQADLFHRQVGGWSMVFQNTFLQ